VRFISAQITIISASSLVESVSLFRCLHLPTMTKTDNHGSSGYCGNKLNGNSRQVNTESSLRCDDPVYACAGDPTEQCGGFGTFGFVCSRHMVEQVESNAEFHSTPSLVRHLRHTTRTPPDSNTSSIRSSLPSTATTFTSDATLTRTV
jgi:hypothetical protein